jgi:serine/threonine-protein kinase HipA
MRQGEVFNNGILTGIISENEKGEFMFRYDDDYFRNINLPAISLTLPKSKQIHRSKKLFPFFYNMLSEGSNRLLQSKVLKIDERDHFAFLLKTASRETIGAITVKEIVQ